MCDLLNAGVKGGHQYNVLRLCFNHNFMFLFKVTVYVRQKVYDVFTDLIEHNQLNQLVQLSTKHFGSILTLD